MILCDTNILIDFYKRDLHIVGELRVIQTRQIVISPVTVHVLRH